jgi:hypothetical protein
MRPRPNELEYLRKQNRILKREIGRLKKENKELSKKRGGK